MKKYASRKNRVSLSELAQTDFKLRHQGSVLGFAWMQPDIEEKYIVTFTTEEGNLNFVSPGEENEIKGLLVEMGKRV